MNVLSLLWWTSIAMAAGSMGWMIGLIVGRHFRTEREARYAAERKIVEGALVALMQGGVAERRRLVPQLRGAHATAEALVEVLALFRGADRERLLANLRGLGVDDVLRRGAADGKTVSRLLCIEALAAFPGEDTEALLGQVALTAADPDLRWAAVRSLLDIGADLPINRLLDAMVQDGVVASGPVVEILHKVAARWPTELAATLDRRNLPAKVRALIVEALGETGDYSLLPLLSRAAAHDDAEVRAAAMRALGELAHPAAAPALRTALSDEAWAVRGLAAEAVGRSGLSELSPELEVLLADSIWWVRHRVAAALVRLGPAGLKRLAAVAESSSDVAGRAASLALAELG